MFKKSFIGIHIVSRKLNRKKSKGMMNSEFRMSVPQIEAAGRWDWGGYIQMSFIVKAAGLWMLISLL